MEKIYGMHKLVGLQLFWSRTPTFSSGTPTFCQMGVLNSCFQNPSESSALANSEDPDERQQNEMQQNASFHLVLQCLQKQNSLQEQKCENYSSDTSKYTIYHRDVAAYLKVVRRRKPLSAKGTRGGRA